MEVQILTREPTGLKGWLLALPAFVLVMLPRGAPALLAGAGVYCCVKLRPRWPELRQLSLWLMAAAAYPALSSIWAVDPRRALSTVAGVVAHCCRIGTRLSAGRRVEGGVPACLSLRIPLATLVSLLDILFDLPLRAALAGVGIDWVGQPSTVRGHVVLSAGKLDRLPSPRFFSFRS